MWHLVQDAAIVTVNLADWFFSLLCKIIDGEGAHLEMILWCSWHQ